MAHKIVHQQLDKIAFDGNMRRPRRDLIADTLTFGLDIHLSCSVTIAGGTTSGTIVKEAPDTLVPNLRIFDGSREPIVEVSMSELRQLLQRQEYGQAAPGTMLANGDAQVGTVVRRVYRILFADPRSENPIETALRPRDKDNFYIEPEWVDTTAAAVAAALVTGGDRAITVQNLEIKIVQIHDPEAFQRVRPLYMPRIRRYEFNVPATTPNYQAHIKTSADGIRMALLHSLDAGVTTEGIINIISMRTDRDFIREAVDARLWHERELTENSALENAAGIAMAYFGFEFADNGRLSTVLRPYQGGNLRYVLDITGSASRIVRAVHVELERVDGLVAPREMVPAGLLD